jgi:GntR family transcriptional regulator
MATPPLYARIADRLAQDIATGRYAVGSTLPTELELADQLQVSRATVRAALSGLESRKLVSRRKNAGTRVEAAAPRAGYGAALTSLSDLLQWAQACQRAVQHTDEIVMDQQLAQQLGCAPGSRWVRVQSLRLDADKGRDPVSWTDAYIDTRYRDVLPAVLDQPTVLMSQLLQQRFGIDLATVEQEVSGGTLGAALASALKAEPDGVALRVVRRYLTGNGQPALVTVSTHPADRFSIKTTLTRA